MLLHTPRSNYSPVFECRLEEAVVRRLVYFDGCVNLAYEPKTSEEADGAGEYRESGRDHDHVREV